MPTIKTEYGFEVERAILVNSKLPDELKLAIELDLGHGTSDMDAIENLLIAGYEVNIMKVKSAYGTPRYEGRAYFKGGVDTKVCWGRSRDYDQPKEAK